MKSLSLGSVLNTLGSVTGVLAPDIISADLRADSIGDKRHWGVYLADLGKLPGDIGTIPRDSGAIPGATDTGTTAGVRVRDKGLRTGVTGVTGVESRGRVRVRHAGMIAGSIRGTVIGVTGTIPEVTGVMGTMPGVRVVSAGTVNGVRDMGTILGDMGTIPGVTGVIAVCPTWDILPMDPKGLIGVVLAVRLAPECAVCVYVYVLVYVSRLDSVCDIGVWRFDREE